MSALDWLKATTELLDVLAWPAIAGIGLLLFRSHLGDLFNRMSSLEGRVGKASVRLELEQVVREGIEKAVQLEASGKSDEARRVVSNTSQLALQLAGLTADDLMYLEHLFRGGQPKRRWGPPQLVRAGFVEFDGGNLTEQGEWLMERYAKMKARNDALEH